MPASDPIISLAPDQPLLSPDGHDWSWAYVLHREIPGFPGYAVGTDGSVWSLWARGGTHNHIGKVWRPRKPGLIHGGERPMVTLWKSSKGYSRLVHRLVLETFVSPRPEGLVCCHGNGNPRDNRLLNLRWDTSKANSADMIRHGTRQQGERVALSKLTDAQIPEIKAMLARGVSQRRTGAIFGVSHSTIGLIVRGKRWNHVP